VRKASNMASSAGDRGHAAEDSAAEQVQSVRRKSVSILPSTPTIGPSDICSDHLLSFNTAPSLVICWKFASKLEVHA